MCLIPELMLFNIPLSTLVPIYLQLLDQEIPSLISMAVYLLLCLKCS